ncbi:ATP-binding protein [Streptomyces sp. TS71-3]|uniref:ATP-binding protein n=1 Tax=Streptomyces sp. TS71-3 TaxID=2733862 RepID=UPI001B0ED1EE|nr:ATP-binding protein [Streptomyces sp. TS71-3]GHJ35782.1 hypothetical protein Sm713_13910 [Streptomyces sp. TS71-3]
MSLPLPRRIARAALLLAAGAAPVVGAAGAASAAALPAAAGPAGLSTLDTAHLGSTVESASQKVGKTAGVTDASPVRTVKKALPDVTGTLGKGTGSIAPTADSVVGGVAKGGLPVR